MCIKSHKQQKPSVNLNIVTVNLGEHPELLIVLDGVVVKSLFDTVTERCFISYSIYNKHLMYKKLKHSNHIAHYAQGTVCE